MSDTSTETYLRKPWGSSVRIEDDLWRLRLKNPVGSLLVNTFVYRHRDTLAVIDPGWPWEVQLLEDALSDLGFGGIKAVTHWLYTHSHVDHMGAAVLLQRRSEAPHMIWPWVEPELERWHHYQDRVNDWTPWVEAAFAEPQRSQILKERTGRSAGGARMLELFGPGALTHTRRYEVGETVKVGALRLELLDARGHDPSHLALWEPSRRWLFSGDLLLAMPSPLSRAMGDDLTLYEESLQRIARLPAELLLTGHGTHQRGEDIARAVARSRDQVASLDLNLRQALSPAPTDLYTLALKMAGGKALEPVSRWWVQIANTDTHLQRMVVRGEAELVEDARGPLYRGRG
ncbi:MBL fold metallo-hydrolase [Lujinxingia vulgaris]|uniref:MBL fold metallo-hydrolase n=1 Tax=Lujinxingia vulgaris TaxID=2600176 RepID=A0A5C6WXI4_9DELT|nr:MBL fold metallo-hydrolase [Lujinxingia vulgaris]TXD34153.1 MBL fold metallo-hydrolase [Lujinxingia vulgaris]